MKNLLLCSVVIYWSTCIARGAEVNSLCGNGSGWIPYKDEKCVKLFKTFETQQRADELCGLERSESDSFVPSLVSIRSFDEQQFLTEYVFNSSDSNHIWIGAERRPESSTEFIWTDGSPVQRFTHWAVDHPTDDARRSCVLLQSPLSNRLVADLRWLDVSCTSGNWFICEKLQAWPMDHIQRTILGTRRDLQYEVESLGTQLKDLQENPVPIGFVYVQLSGQPEPRNVWTTVRWTEITSTYAGLFFRAAGGGAAGFGSTQTENSPRLTSLNRINTFNVVNTVSPVPGVLSAGISAGTIVGIGSHSALRFQVSSGEVRPRNQAVRIWRRIE